MSNLITESELARLKASRTEDEWNAVCDAVKEARGGQYPSDWYQKVLMSSWVAGVHAKFTRANDLVRTQDEVVLGGDKPH